ncbi:MAG: enoyl-CoA hydratase/isomerase family protein [Sneathiella sp.]|nr:enoyl-CoA hydratase/isomerase family protein [Sneathiella sp.]
MEDYKALEFVLKNRVGTITMTRPEIRNAFSDDLRNDFLKLFRDIQYRTDIGAIIIRGSDGVFSGGGNLKSLNESEQTPVEKRRRIQSLHDWFQLYFNLEIPVIAAVDGAAYGGGFALALGADFVLCSEKARLCCVFSRIGLVPDVGALFTLPRIVGLQRAKEIAMTNRPIFAEEAKTLGIAMEVYPVETLYEEADKLARRLCKSSTPAQGLTKKS